MKINSVLFGTLLSLFSTAIFSFSLNETPTNIFQQGLIYENTGEAKSIKDVLLLDKSHWKKTGNQEF